MHLTPWILSPLVWFFLPGYALAPARIGKPLHVMRIIGISFLITSAVSLLLVFAGHFNARLVTLALMAFLPLAAVRFIKRVRTGKRGWDFNSLAAELGPFLCFVGMIGGIALLYVAWARAIPSEPLRGACDAGVYASASVHLDRTGRFDWKADELLPPEPAAKAMSLRTTPYQFPWKETWPGIIQVSGDRFSPQFFPLYPVWLSLFHCAFGSHSYLALNLWCALCLMGSFLVMIGRSMVPLRFAFILWIPFCLDPGLVYFLNIPLSEILLSFIFTATLAFLVYGLRHRIRSFLVLSACFLTAGLATKYMAWFLLAPLALLWVLSDQKKFMAKNFGIPLALSGLFPLMCLRLWNYPHFLNHFLPQERLVQAGGFVLGLVLVWRLARMNFVRRGAPFAIGALLTLAVIAFLFVLPNASEINEENVLPELAWYTGWGWLMLAFIGCWVLLYRKGKDVKPILVFFLLMLGVALAGTADNPLHPFAFRRNIPVLLPMIALLAAVGLHWLRRLGPVVLAAIVLFAAIPPLVLGLPMMTAGEGRGFLPLLMKVSQGLPDGPVYALTDAEWIGSQAQLLAGKPVYPLHLESAEGLEVYQGYAAARGEVKLLTAQVLPYNRLGEWSGEIEQIRQERNQRPSIVEKRPVRLFLYDVPLDRTRVGDRLEVGGDDFGRVAGFWGPEKDGARSFRWSRQWCHFTLETGSRLTLTMSSSGHAENPVPYRIYSKDLLVAEGFAIPGWNDYPFDLPPALRDRPVVLSLVTHTFQPRQDTRDLGLRVSHIF